jgi:hypothetical protein
MPEVLEVILALRDGPRIPRLDGLEGGVRVEMRLRLRDTVRVRVRGTLGSGSGHLEVDDRKLRLVPARSGPGALVSGLGQDLERLDCTRAQHPVRRLVACALLLDHDDARGAVVREDGSLDRLVSRAAVRAHKR